MIYTLTPNPAIDYNICCDGLQPNTVTRTRDAVYTPNGKGLNVSFTLDHYGVDTAILGFFAGFSGRYIVEGARELGAVSYTHLQPVPASFRQEERHDSPAEGSQAQ